MLCDAVVGILAGAGIDVLCGIVGNIASAGIHAEISSVGAGASIQCVVTAGSQCQRREGAEDHLFHELIFIHPHCYNNFAGNPPEPCLMRSLLLLHGALGAPAQFEPLQQALAGKYALHAPALPGHAGVASDNFSIETFAGAVQEYINQHRLQQPLVFGYSMGGYVALYLEAIAPGSFGAIATLATKLHWTPDGAAREAKILDPDTMESKLPAFAATLRDRHAPLNWKEVTMRTAAMMKALGGKPLLDADVFSRLSLPVLLLLGDRDNMVSLDETVTTQKAIAGAALGVLPSTAHPMEKADPVLLALLLDRFFKASEKKQA